MTTTVHLNTTEAGEQITRRDLHWGPTLGDEAGPISFGFRTSAAGYTVFGSDISLFSPLSVAQQAAARAALGFWADVANITFTDRGNTNNATILFANYFDLFDGAAAFAFPPSSGDTSPSSREGDIFLNRVSISLTDVGPGTDSFETIIHEIGHALGLGHPGNYNADPGVNITYQDHAEYIEDTVQYSVMSYFDETNTGANYLGLFPATPMLHDIAAIQRLYGANNSARTGSTTYGFHSNAGSPYSIASSSQKVVFTVWDAGGTDTFDFSGYSQTQTINLNAERFSSVGGLISNVAIARGVTIEKAIGGTGSDTILANAVNNTLRGGLGSDTINGGLGADSAVFSGVRSAYTLTALGGSGVRVSGPDGVDTLTNVENLVFNDQTVTWPPSSTSVSINDVTITEGNGGTKLAIFTVTRTGGTGAFAVNYATANNSAVSGSDYVATSGALSFGSGVNTKTISVVVNGDIAIESNETFFVNLSGVTNGATIIDNRGQATIANDDLAVAVGSMSIDDVTITEGDSGTKLATFTVTRTGGTAAFAVSYATANNSAAAGNDYIAASGTLSFGNGVNSRTISVTIIGDIAIESSETFFINLSGATNGATVVDGQGRGTITNDDFTGSLFTEGPDTVALSLPGGTWRALGGNDLVTGTSGADTVFGDGGNDNLQAGANSDRLDGGAGDDVLNGGTGADVLTGGAGGDRYTVDNLYDVIVETAASGGSDIVFAEVSYILDVGVSVEMLRSTNTNANVAITLIGNALPNILVGDLGTNVISGEGGADSLYGFAGHDVYIVDHAGDRVFESANEGFDQVNSAVSFTLGAHIENLTLTGIAPISGIGNALSNTITGNGAANLLSGGGNNDRLDGGGGNDGLDGGAGSDFLQGDVGNDRYTVDGLHDVIVEVASAGNDVVFASGSYALAAGLSVETLRSINTDPNAALTLIGNELSNTVVGDLGNNVIDGGQGADQMHGFAGNDIYAADHVADKVFEGANAGFDQVNSTVSFTLSANVESLTLGGSAAIGGTGNVLANNITGNGAANTLDGSLGSDVLTGGAGADKFNFTTALSAGNVDILPDFAVAQDGVQLENAIFTALGATGTLAAEKFFIGAAAHDADDRIVYDSATGALSYDADGNAAGAAVQFAALATGLALTNAHFQVI